MKLIISELQKSFDKTEVLRGASYTFSQGRIYGLLGRNGAGKTTLFNCLNEDLRADGGTFELEDDGGTRRPITPDDIGYVLSTPVVPEFLTAREFLKFFLDINRNRIPYPKAPDVYLDYMQIDEASRGKLLKDFSHGMKNKMQMLVNFIADPPILLLDEPLTSLDVVVADEMKNLLRRRKGDHITILSTHIMDLALDLCDDIVILHNGVLAPVQREQLDDESYKDRIIAALKEEDDHA
jgi:ABC-2 type transport system ATP-binding protein